jgi:hypothetical protein
MNVLELHFGFRNRREIKALQTIKVTVQGRQGVGGPGGFRMNLYL